MLSENQLEMKRQQTFRLTERTNSWLWIIHDSLVYRTAISLPNSRQGRVAHFSLTFVVSVSVFQCFSGVDTQTVVRWAEL